MHDPRMPGDLYNEGFEVEANFISTFVVQPVETKTSHNVRSLAMHRRKCRFESESEDLKVMLNARGSIAQKNAKP